jgi:hypothetical protein
MTIVYSSSTFAIDGTKEKSVPKVTKVTSNRTLFDRNATKIENNIPAAGVGDEIILTISNLDVLLTDVQQNQKNTEPLLFINNIAMHGIKPVSKESSSGKIVYLLKRDTDSGDAWSSLLGNWKFTELYKTVSISIGNENKAIPSDVQLRLIFIKGWPFVIWLISVLFLAGLFLYLGIKTPILKYTDNASPYSLSKTQMIIWIFVILSSYMFIWIVIQDFNSVNDTALKLLGLSLISGGAAIFIDTRKSNRVNKLTAESSSLQNIIKDLKLKISSLQSSLGDQLVSLQKDLNDKTMQKAIVDDRIDNYPVSNNSSAETFIKDILQDADGWSLPRVQVFLWTIVLVVIFIKNVYSQLAMPEFNESLLYLMGISQGAYLGFKLPEKT